MPRPWRRRWNRWSKLSLSDSIETFLHRFVFPRDAQQIAGKLHNEMALGSDLPQFLQYFLAIHTEQFPVRVIEHRMVAQSGKVGLVRQIERGCGLDAERDRKSTR